MKKILTLCFSILLGFVGFAQTNPNRILVHEVGSGYKGFLAERVDSITFVQLEGEVSAAVEFLGYAKGEDSDTIMMAVTRTEKCVGFSLAVLPTVMIKRYNDEQLISVVLRDNNDVYYQDFTNAALTGLKLEASTDYTIVTVGMDTYGIACGVKKAEFTTPATPLLGNPFVELALVDVGLTEFSVEYKPNEDVMEYYALAMEKGQLEVQFEMFAPMFGYKNLGEMVKAFGQIPRYTTDTVIWRDMKPGTEYTVYVQALDKAGTYAELNQIDLTTTVLGGPGAATVSIELTDYVLSDWWGEMLPSQYILFVPNDQAACYRFGVFTAAEYDADPEGCKAGVCSEPPMPNMANWFFYEPLETDFQINPNTACVALAAAKNTNGEWGEITELRFTTPDQVDGASDSSNKRHSLRVQTRRSASVADAFTPGKAPQIRPLSAKRGIVLTEQK